jgi:hypothetical protein
MLSDKKCKEILEKNGKKYSAEQVKLIRDALYTLGQIDYLIFKDKCNETGTGRNLHQSVNG